MKTKVLIIGAGGAIAHHVISFLQKKENIELTLFARSTERLNSYKPSAKIIKGDVLNKENINTAVKGQDIIYANLSGAVDQMAKEIIDVMTSNGVKRLIFVTALGIYNEVPGKFGEWNNRMIGSELARYRKAADVIEKSLLDYTIVRPSWLTDKDETEYETSQKGEKFTGTEVARKAVGAYIASIIENPLRDVKASVGVQKPGTEGDKPAFY